MEQTQKRKKQVRHGLELKIHVQKQYRKIQENTPSSDRYRNTVRLLAADALIFEDELQLANLRN
ncbi:hypothetical protein [Spirosoma fluminis]